MTRRRAEKAENAEARLPRNMTNSVVSGGSWGLNVFCTLLGWILAVGSIAAASYAIAKWKSIKSDIRGLVAPPGTVEIDTHDIYPATIVLLVFSCLICLFLLCTFIWLLVNSPGRKARGFFTSAASLYIPAFVVFVLVWLFFADLVAYSRYLATRTASIQVFRDGVITNPDDTLLQDIQVGVGFSPRYKNVTFLRAVAVVGWVFWFFVLLALVMLFVGAAEGCDEYDAPEYSRVSKDREVEAGAAAPASTLTPGNPEVTQPVPVISDSTTVEHAGAPLNVPNEEQLSRSAATPIPPVEAVPEQK